MKFLREIVEDVQILIEESESKEKQYFIEGIFMQCDKKNRNGRIYPISNVRNEVNRYIEQQIQTKRSMGELGHPPGPNINLDRVSHLITEMRNDGKDYYGKAKIIDTPFGKIAKNLVDEGISFGVSTRGFGSISKSNNSNIVESDFRLSTVDIVADPSAPDAWVTGIMENKEYYFENGILKEKDYESIQKEIRESTKSEMDEGKLLEMFERFITKFK